MKLSPRSGRIVWWSVFALSTYVMYREISVSTISSWVLFMCATATSIMSLLMLDEYKEKRKSHDI